MSEHAQVRVSLLILIGPVLVALRTRLRCFQYGHQSQYRLDASQAGRQTHPTHHHLGHLNHHRSLQWSLLLPVHLPMHPISILLDEVHRRSRTLYEHECHRCQCVRLLGYHLHRRLDICYLTVRACVESTDGEDAEILRCLNLGHGCNVCSCRYINSMKASSPY